MAVDSFKSLQKICVFPTKTPQIIDDLLWPGSRSGILFPQHVLVRMSSGFTQSRKVQSQEYNLYSGIKFLQMLLCIINMLNDYVP